MNDAILNLEAYTPLQILLYSLGGLSWVVFYSTIIRNAHRHAFAAVPLFGLAGFIGWEILWGFFFRPNMGQLFFWGLKVYLPMSLYVGWLTLRHGAAQFHARALQQRVPLVLGLSVAAWTAIFYFFIPAVDDRVGMTTAHILSLTMSAGYIPLLLNLHEREGDRDFEKIPALLGWSKLVATSFTTAFCTLRLADERPWLIAICFVNLTVDFIYLAIYYRLKGATGREGVAAIGSAS